MEDGWDGGDVGALVASVVVLVHEAVAVAASGGARPAFFDDEVPVGRTRL